MGMSDRFQEKNMKFLLPFMLAFLSAFAFSEGIYHFGGGREPNLGPLYPTHGVPRGYRYRPRPRPVPLADHYHHSHGSHGYHTHYHKRSAEAQPIIRHILGKIKNHYYNKFNDDHHDDHYSYSPYRPAN